MSGDSMTLDDLATEVRGRLDSISDDVTERISDQALRRLVTETLQGLPEDERSKLVFGQENGPGSGKLVGTKYARWGLSLADVEFLYDLQTSLAGQNRRGGGGLHPGPSQELSNTFAAISEAVYLPTDKIRQLDRKALDDLFPRIPLAEFHGKDRTLARRGEFHLTGAYQRAVLAMDTAEDGFGQQLIGAQYVGDLWEAPRRLGRVFPLIDTFEMTDPTAYLPVEVDIPEMLFVSESTGSSSSEYPTVPTGSNRVQVDARKFIIHQMWSGEMEEDSIIPYIPFLRRQAAFSLAHYSDSAVLNGDTTNAVTGNINLDDADPADDKHYLAFDGIRHAALIDNTANRVDAAAAPITLSRLNGLRSLMIDSANLHDWGHPINPRDLVHFADPETADQAALIDEVLTVDKYGRNATIMNGELGSVLGNPLISTIAQPKTEADGAVSTTASNNTQGQITSLNTRGVRAGWRRRVQVETERLPARDQTRIVYSLRMGLGRFTPTGAASGIEWATVLRNIGL